MVPTPSFIEPIRINDLPTLLAPYAESARVFCYLLACGRIQATRIPLSPPEDLLLVLAPRGTLEPD